MTFCSVVIFSTLILLGVEVTRGNVDGTPTINNRPKNTDVASSIFSKDRPFGLGFNKRDSKPKNYAADKATEVLFQIITTTIQDAIHQMEPILFKINETIILEEGSFRLKFNLVNAQVDSLSKVTTRRIVSKIEDNKVEFTLVFPVLKISGTTYKLDGKVNSKTIKTAGIMSGNATNLEVNASLEYEVSKEAVQVKSLQLHYSFKDLKVKVTNLSIPLYSTDKINKQVTNMMTKYLEKNEKQISKKLANYTQKNINELLRSFKI